MSELGGRGLWRRAARRLRSVHPVEGVALGLGSRPWAVDAMTFLPNGSGRSDAFEIEAKDVLQALVAGRRCGLRATLWLHTHPGGSVRPSQSDLQAMMAGPIHLWPGCWLGVLRLDRDLSGEIALARPLGSGWMTWMGDFERFRREGLSALHGTVRS